MSGEVVHRFPDDLESRPHPSSLADVHGNACPVERQAGVTGVDPIDHCVDDLRHAGGIELEPLIQPADQHTDIWSSRQRLLPRVMQRRDVISAPGGHLSSALERAKDAGFSHVILDGKIIACDRCKEPAISVKGQVIDLWYSGKAHCHGGNIQTVIAPAGFPLWVVGRRARLGARPHRRPHPRPARPLPRRRGPAHPGRTRLRGSGHRHPHRRQTAHKRGELDINTRTRNALQRSLRCLGERGFALLTGRWRTLHHITASSSRIGGIARAALVLTHFEHGYIT
jgi:hypothetical protein